MPKVQLSEASTATPTIEAQRPHSATTVQAPTEGVQTTAFFRAFAGRVRETVAPEHARTADLFGRVTDSLIAHGATPGQAAALRKIARDFDGSDDPAALAAQVMARTAAEQNRNTTGCTALDGLCVSHQDDHGETIHHGPEFYIPTGPKSELPPLQLAKYGDDQPCIVYGAGAHTLDLAAADGVINAERQHLAALVTARRHLAAALTPVATEVARQWTITTDTGDTASGHLPPFADGNPSETGIPADLLQLALEDLTHRRNYDGQTVTVDIPAAGGRYTGPEEILLPHIQLKPHSTDPADRVPTVSVELVSGGDHWIGPLDPAGVIDLAAKLRAHADRLDQVAAELTDARADWAKNGSTR